MQRAVTGVYKKNRSRTKVNLKSEKKELKGIVEAIYLHYLD